MGMPYLRRGGACRPSHICVCALLCVFAFVGSARMVHAQTVVMNPRTVSFVPSDDHNAVTANGQPVITRYDMEIFLAGGGQPVAVVNLGKPGPAGDGSIYVDFASLLASAPMPGVALEARVASVGPTGRGESAPSNRFQFESAPTPAPAPTPTPAAPAPSSPVPSAPAPTSPANNVQPTLCITAPGSGAALKVGQWVMLSAAATGQTGQVVGVDFYVNGAFAGTATKSPFRVAWHSEKTGRFTIAAVAVVNGAQVKSAPVVVTVSRIIASPRTPPSAAAASGRARARQ